MNNGPSEENLIMLLVMGGVAFGLLLAVVIGSICSWLAARAVAAVPVEQRRIQPSAIWGIQVLSWLIMIVSGGTTYLLAVNPEPSDAVLYGNLALSVTFGLLQSVWIWWVGIALPRSFEAAFGSYEGDPGVPDCNHGRTLGLAMLAVYTVFFAVSQVATFAMGGGNPVADVRRQMAQQQDPDLAQQIPQMVVGCANAILGVAYMVLLIIFLVSITRSRRALLDLQYETSTGPDDDRLAPPASY